MQYQLYEQQPHYTGGVCVRDNVTQKNNSCWGHNIDTDALIMWCDWVTWCMAFSFETNYRFS